MTTNRQEARARLLKTRAAAAAERQERERKNITDLTEFAVQSANVDEVDAWLTARIEKLRVEADERRARFRVAAGRALAAVRARGESASDIAKLTGVAQAKVREYLKLADDASEQAPAAPEPGKPPGPPAATSASEPGLKPVGKSDGAASAPTAAEASAGRAEPIADSA